MDDMTEDDRRAVAEVERHAASLREEAQLRAKMPHDPSLGLDACFLRDYGVPAALFVKQVMLGEREATAEQLACAKMLLPIETRAQATKVISEVSVHSEVAEWLSALRQSNLTLEEVALLESHIESQANAAGITKH